MRVLHTHEWQEFMWAVGNHIREYTVKQYGNWPDDQMTGFSDEFMAEQIKRYENRRGRGARGLEEERRDCLKIAHYTQVIETGQMDRIEGWEQFKKHLLRLLDQGTDLKAKYPSLCVACEHWTKLPEPDNDTPDCSVLLNIKERSDSREVMVAFSKADHSAQVPVYATPGAAGCDLYAARDTWILPFQRRVVKTGLAVEIPEGHEIQIRPRSGIALKSSLLMPNAPGTIDSDYRGEIGVVLMNFSLFPVKIRKGTRIAQAVLSPVARARFWEVSALGETDRGSGGFGSTGI